MTRIFIFCGFASARQDGPSVDCKQSLIFFFAKLLHAKPKDASGKAASREKRWCKPEAREEKKETRDAIIS